MAYRQNDSQGRNDRVRYDLMERIGVLSRKDNGWTREVNIVSWNDGPGKVDIREWDPDHKRMTRGVTLFEDEAERLTKVLARRYGLRLSERGSRSYAEPVSRPPGDTLPESAVPEETPPERLTEMHSGQAYDTMAAAVPADEAAEVFAERSDAADDEAAEAAGGESMAPEMLAML